MSTEFKKIGAGYFIVSDGEALLLLRGRYSNNPHQWGVPGGNLEDNETAIEGALREAKEELGLDMSIYSPVSEIRTIRGKNLDKLFTIFVVKLSTEEKENFTPTLNDEHEEYRWWKVDEISSLSNLHSVVDVLVNKHGEELTNALAS